MCDCETVLVLDRELGVVVWIDWLVCVGILVRWLSDCMGVVECLNTPSSSPSHGMSPSCSGGHSPPKTNDPNCSTPLVPSPSGRSPSAGNLSYSEGFCHETTPMAPSRWNSKVHTASMHVEGDGAEGVKSNHLWHM